MKHAWDLGINFFYTAEDTTEDTAEVYGLGQAEIQMGIQYKIYYFLNR